MKIYWKTAIYLSAIFFYACGSDTTGNQTEVDNSGDSTTVFTDTSSNAGTVPVRPDCQIPGTILDGNQFWAKTENLLVTISADKETLDPDLGDSHRILTIYDGNNCQQVFKEVLPVNLSADFPYYLSDITYNNLSKVVAIRGFDKLFILDMASRKLSKPMTPKFLNNRFTEDAQSGMIQRLEVWERYMIGIATGMGAFVFDLSNPQQPSPVLPIAEYELEKGVRYNSLFALKSSDADDGYQLMMPDFDYENETFQINPLLPKPANVDININRQFRNNRQLVLKEMTGNEKRPIAIDMSKMKKYDLPAEVAAMKDTEIIEWMKKQ
jgi:hypothetical protein